MKKFDSRSISPSRRRCIRGENCQQKCCTMRIKVGSGSTPSPGHNSNKATTSPKPGRPGPGGDHSHHDSSNTDEYSNSSSDDQGQDTVDAEIPCRPKFPDLRNIPLSRDNSGEIKFRTNANQQNITHVHQQNNRTDIGRKFSEETNVPLRNQTVSKVWLVPVIMAVLIAIYLLIPRNEYTQDDFKKDLRDIGLEYKINEDAIFQIQHGIENTFIQQDTVTIMFLYRNMDDKVLSEFVNKVANASAKYLRTGAENPIILKQSDLTMSSGQELIDKYRYDFENQGVMLLQNLENIPVNLAKAFHYYCDEFSPLAKKTAVFFTLDLDECTGFFDKSSHKFVEGCLREKWRKLQTDELMPLLARVINVVVDLEKH